MNVIINVLRVPVGIFICVCACKVCVVCALCCMCSVTSVKETLIVCAVDFTLTCVFVYNIMYISPKIMCKPYLKSNRKSHAENSPTSSLSMYL